MAEVNFIESEGESELVDRINFDDIIDDSIENGISAWVKQIVHEVEVAALAEDNGDRDNIMENRPFAQYFIRLCQMLPLWSGISAKHFKSPYLTASSWCSETHFKNTKQLHGNEIPCAADEFVKRDIQFNNSTVVLASKRYIASTAISSKPKTKTPKPLDKSTSVELQTAQAEKISTINNNALSEIPDDSAHEERDHSQHRVACIACADGNTASGAHKCMYCNKAVHIFAECSISMGEEEGYGEKRQCIDCYNKKSVKSTLDKETESAQALRVEEKWAKNPKKSTKTSKYLQTVPNYGLTPVNNKMSIPLLINANRNKTGHTVKGKKIILGNTCAIDSLIHLIAAAYSYHREYNLNVIGIKDPIFDISRMLATG